MRNCYLIGGTTLLKECLNYLCQANIKVLGVFTDDLNIVAFCQERSIDALPLVRYWNIKETSCDYLFSIVNPIILPEEILDYVHESAINYHDSLLPKYAGVNAVPWAILNGEKIHGITWHKIDKSIDTGNILLQKTIAIAEDETTISLNLQCYQMAIETFPLVLKRLENETMDGVRQNLADRTLNRYQDKPYGNGFINWDESTESIDQILRALDFGNFENTLTTAKIIINDQVFIINDYEKITCKHYLKSGDLTKINDSSIHVATKDGYIEICKLLDLNNKPINIKQLARQSLEIRTLNRIELRQLQMKAQVAAKYESYWCKEIINMENSSVINVSPRGNFKQNKLLWRLNIQSELSNEEVAALFCFYFYRLTNYSGVSLKLLRRDTCGGIIHQIMLPFNICCNDTTVALSIIKDKLASYNEKDSYDIDLFCRREDLQNKLFSCSLLIDYNSGNINLNKLNHHGLLVKISSKRGLYHIAFYQTNCKLNENAKYLCENISEHVKNLLEASMRGIDLAKVEILSVREISAIKKMNQRTKIENNLPDTFIEKFLTIAASQSKAIAIVESEYQYTYGEISLMSNELAYQIMNNNNLEKQKVVAIHCTSGTNYIIAALAILRLGCVFTPIDTQYPSLRKDHILSDSNADIILTDDTINVKSSKQTVVIKIIPEKLKRRRIYTELNKSHKDDIMYLMYTSGSTGKPKGVLVKQSSFMNLLAWYCKICLNKEDKTYILTSLSFDLTQKNIFALLIVGGQIHFRDHRIFYDADHITQYVKDKMITHMNCPTAAFLPLIENRDHIKRLKSLKNLVLGAQSFSGRVLQDLILSYPKLNVFNSYGPAECTDVCSCYKIKYDDVMKNQNIPIEPPIPNTEMFILDRNQKLLPIAVVGELYVTGYSVSMGYLNYPKNTSRVFLENHVSISQFQGKMYHTGDRALLTAHGHLVFINRKDKQVKIRGYRIELGEVESILTAIEGVLEAAVIAHGPEHSKRLYGFVVPMREFRQKIIEKKLFIKLKVQLPSYMVPARIFVIDKMPLTPHGKVDQTRLTQILASDQNMPEGKIVPMSDFELMLAKIWSNLLEQTIRTNDEDFFKVGGDSLSAVKLVNEIEKHFYVSIKVIDIYQQSVLKVLATFIQSQIKKQKIKEMTNKLINTNKTQLVSWQQKAVILVNKTHPELTTLYNSAYCFNIEGNIDIEILKQSIKTMYENYQILRENYHVSDTLDITKHFNYQTLEIKTHYCQDEDLKNLVINQQLDIEVDNLFIVELFIISQAKLKLIIRGHHCITDAESLRILCQYISKCYRAICSGSEIPSLIDYIDYDTYIAWQEHYFKTNEYRKLLSEYVKDFSNYKPQLLFYDHLPLNTFTISSRCINFNLKPEIYSVINSFCHKQKIGHFSFLWAVVGLLIHNYVNSQTVYAGTYVANRYPYCFSETVGFFANLLLLKIDFKEDISFVEFTKRSHQEMLHSINRHHIPINAVLRQLKLENQANITTQVPLGIEYINYRQLTELKLGDSKATYEILDYNNGKFNLSFRFFQLDPEFFNCTVEYNSRLFTEDTIQHVICDFKLLVNRVLENYEAAISSFYFSQENHLKLNTKLDSQQQVEYKGLLIDLPKLASSIREIIHAKDCAIYYCKNVFYFCYINKVEIDKHLLNQKIQPYLPYNMRIEHFIRVSRLPSYEELLNGKLDIVSANQSAYTDDISSLISNETILERVATIWHQCLGLKAIDYRTDFFALGGESMVAIDILRMIADEFKINIDIQDFFQNPTIEALSDYLNNAINLSNNLVLSERIEHKDSAQTPLQLCQYQPVIEFQLHENYEKILFCIHPLLNNASIYKYFSSLFDHKIRFLGINSYNYYHNNKITDIKLLASLYKHEVLKYQNVGPFYIMGWSFGGMVAYEVAQQLLHQGLKVSSLYLLDSFVLTNDIKLHFKKLTNYFKRIGHDIYSINPLNSQDSNHFRELLEIELAMMMDYVYEPYRQQVILFKAQEAFTSSTSINSDEKIHFEQFQNYLLNQANNGYEQYIDKLRTINLETNHHYLLNNTFGKIIAHVIGHDIFNVPIES